MILKGLLAFWAAYENEDKKEWSLKLVSSIRWTKKKKCGNVDGIVGCSIEYYVMVIDNVWCGNWCYVM